MNTDPKGTPDMNTATDTIRVSYWAKANRYAAACCYCADSVPALAGYTWKDRAGGKYLTSCYDCARANNRHIPDIRRDYATRYGVREVVSADTVSLVRLDTRERVDSHICCDCGQVVGLVKSARGRWYICESRAAEAINPDSIGSTEHTRCAPWLPHTCPEVR